MNLNKVYLVGTLTREPEVRETHGGSTVVRIVVSVSRDYFSKERNQRVRETDSFEVQAWGPLGKDLAASAHKGGTIFVEGRLKQDSWETPSGERRQRTIVHLESFSMTVAPKRAPHGPSSSAGAAPAGAAGAAAPAGAIATGAGEEGGEGDEGANEAEAAGSGPPGASGRRKRRRRRGPRRDGIPAAAPAAVSPEERAAFSAGVTDAPAPSPAAAGDSHAHAPAAAAPPPPAPLPPPAPPAAAPAPKPVSNTSLKEDMPF